MHEWHGMTVRIGPDCIVDVPLLSDATEPTDTLTIEDYGKWYRKGDHSKSDMVPRRGYTHAQPTVSNRRRKVSNKLKSTECKKKLALYYKEDGIAIPFGIALCFSNAVLYYDITCAGKAVNMQPLPREYGERFPKRKMQELAGLDPWEEVYAKRVK